MAKNRKRSRSTRIEGDAPGSQRMEGEDQKPTIRDQLLESNPAFLEKLHTDMWGVVLCRLPIKDYVRSGAVCKSWRRATAGMPWNPKTPWVMFPGADETSGDPDSFRFFTVSDLTPRSLCLPQLRGKHIDGSSHDYIVTSCPTEILLLDPFTAAEVRFPPITIEVFNGQWARFHLMEKLIFSPSSSMAAVLYRGLHNCLHFLSFARVTDASWTPVRSKKFSYNHFRDVIIHKGKLYALDEISLLSFIPSAGRKMNFRRHGYVVTFLNHYHRMYLVESLDGEHLLLVCRMTNESLITNSFKVFRQEKVGRRWVEAGSLGEVAIFVRSNYSTCIFTRGLPELRGNCVYFTEDRTIQQTRDDFKVFSLEDGSIQQLVALQNIRPSS